MSAQTPGPWKLVPQTNGSVMIAHEYETGNQMRPKGLRLIANVLVRGNSLAQDEANAALIATAPETYEALKWALTYGTFEVAADNPMHARALDQARAAIDKAEGRAP